MLKKFSVLLEMWKEKSVMVKLYTLCNGWRREEKLFDKLQRKVHTMKGKKRRAKETHTQREKDGERETARKQCVAMPAKN